MKWAFVSGVLAGLVAAAPASAVTVLSAETDDATISGSAAVGQNINGEQFTFSWDLSGGDTGITGVSAALRLELSGRARLSFDSYVGSPSNQQTGLVLYQIASGTALTVDPSNPGTTGDGVPLVTAASDRLLIGDLASAQGPGLLYDGISGADAFSPSGGSEWVIGIYDSGNPTSADVSFTISAVPLPAAGWMLVAALGGLAVSARTRRRAG